MNWTCEHYPTWARVAKLGWRPGPFLPPTTLPDDPIERLSFGLPPQDERAAGLTPDNAAKHGWVEISAAAPPAFDPTVEVLDPPNFKYVDGAVMAIWTKRPYRADEITMEWKLVRAKRQLLLASSDWTQVSDAPLNAQERSAWAAYRKALRDLPSTGANPFALTWPVRP